MRNQLELGVRPHTIVASHSLVAKGLILGRLKDSYTSIIRPHTWEAGPPTSAKPVRFMTQSHTQVAKATRPHTLVAKGLIHEYL